ncbi:MAG: hypothetical protein QOF45_925 [Gaiellaceae bacterium]|nr:hypothetical protein [Gaiellaceae bacterium]
MRDLPVPDWLFFWGGAVVLVLSFLLLGALWKRQQLERRRAGRPLPAALERFVRSPVLHGILGAVSAGLLILVFLAALLGEPSSAENLTPTFVYVIFWLGIVPLQVLFGNVWGVLNPWLALANAVDWVWRKLGQSWTAPLAYPKRLGVWPAAFFLACFAALELCYVEPASPRALALAIALYSYAMWFGMAAYGRREWDAHGNGFSVYFGLLARIAPFGEHEGRLVWRTPLSGLAGREETPGVLAFVAVMLGSVGFDGFSRSPFWQDLRARVEGPYIIDQPGRADLFATALSLAGLVGCILVVALAYLGAVRLAERTVHSDRSFVPEFVQSLVPIALVYAVAHYFTLLVIQGQYALPLASDPFGYGWDLFGSIDYAPNIAPFSPNTVWYVQVGSLVAGHVAGLTVAHDRAVTILPERDALRSQYAMLGLMVVYTVGGLWLLSRG